MDLGSQCKCTGFRLYGNQFFLYLWECYFIRVLGMGFTLCFKERKLLDDTSSVSPTIRPRWYRRGEGVSYAIVQHSSSYMRAAAVGAVCSYSGTTVPVGPRDVSEGEIRTTKNYVTEKIWTQDLGSGTMLDGTSSTNPAIRPRWYGKGDGASYAIVQQKWYIFRNLNLIPLLILGSWVCIIDMK
jgi:hypothetical protein